MARGSLTFFQCLLRQGQRPCHCPWYHVFCFVDRRVCPLGDALIGDPPSRFMPLPALFLDTASPEGCQKRALPLWIHLISFPYSSFFLAPTYCLPFPGRSFCTRHASAETRRISNYVKKCAVRILLCVPAGLVLRPPTASPFGHGATVGIDQDPLVCHDIQGDITTERQPATVLWCCCGVYPSTNSLHQTGYLKILPSQNYFLITLL